MFCKNCGKEIEDGWSVCPNCGAKLEDAEEKIEKKKNKIKKPFYKKIWFWILIVISLFILVNSFGSSNDKRTNDEIKVQTMEEVGGYQQWVEDGYPGKVRTDIVVELPVSKRESSDYCVHILTSLGDPIVIEQKDGSSADTWEWLQNASADIEGGSTATFKVTLTFNEEVTFNGQTIPKFIVEDIQPYTVEQNTGVNESNNTEQTYSEQTVGNILTLYKALEDNDVIPYTVNDLASQFLANHENYFPCEDYMQIVGDIDRSIEYKHIEKSPEQYGDKLMELLELYVMSISETDIGNGNKFTEIETSDANGYFYYILYPGAVDDVFKDDLIQAVVLPLGISGYDNVSGGTTVTLVGAGAYVEKIYEY